LLIKMKQMLRHGELISFFHHSGQTLTKAPAPPPSEFVV
jgi:hypothetical protein